MGKKTIELCTWDKGTYGERLDELEAIVQDPCFACKTCGRVAQTRKYLCKPVRMSRQDG